MRIDTRDEYAFWAERGSSFGFDVMRVGEFQDRMEETSQSRPAMVARQYGRHHGKRFSCRTYVDRVRITRVS